MVLWVLSEMQDREVASALFHQACVATVEGGKPTMLDITVPATIGRSDAVDGPLPVRAVCYDESVGLVGELLIWVSGGFLSGIEFAWYTDEPPVRLPKPSQLRCE